MKRLNFDILDENHDVTAYERRYISSLLITRPRRNSSPAISTSWPQRRSRGQASAYNWWNTPSELCDFHSQSQGRCWYFRMALETLSMQIRGRVISLPRERELLDPFGVRIWQWIYVAFIWHPGFDSMIATISWRQMDKTIIFCLNFARQLQTNHEQTCAQNRPMHPRVDS